MLDKLERLPADSILGLAAIAKADANPNKVDLTVGVAGVATDVFLVVLSAGCLLSADAFWDIFTKVVPDIVRMGPVKSFRNPFIFLWNRWVATAMPNPESAETPVSALFPGATSVFAGVLVISVLGQLADWLLKRVV